MKINSLGPTLMAESLCNEVFHSNLVKDDGDRNECMPACIQRRGRQTEYYAHTKDNNYEIAC